jgi:signal transduction histidine kinase
MRNKKPLILIIDDIPENIQMLLNILKKKDYRFAVATSADEAFNSIDAERPDLILLDIILPKINGYEICERLKSDVLTADIPVIFLTVMDDVEDILHGFKMGASDYISKPYNELIVVARIENQLKLSTTRKKLKETNDTKNKIFSIIAHDLKNPFSNIVSFSNLFIQRLGNLSLEKQENYLHAINNDAEAGLNLLENLLLWSRTLNGSIELDKIQLNLHEVVEESLNLVKVSAEQKNNTIQNRVPEGFIIHSDRIILSTIIRNLLSNSIKFTENGKIIIDLEQKTDRFFLVFEDTGIGMDGDVLSKLFQMNAHYTTRGTREEKGSGLGLLIVKEFVDLLNGDISVESEPNKYSRFVISLPFGF